MALHLFLIRHAESENNARPDHQRVEDPSITSRGVEQAEHLADWLASHPFDLLVTSPFRRALQTAAPAANRTGQPVEVWCDIYERGGCYVGWREGDRRGAAGMSGEAIVSMVPGAQLESAIGDEGWWGGRPRETDDVATDRADRVRVKLEQRFGTADHSRVVLITHAEFARMLLVALVGNERLDPNLLGRICNAGISYLTFSDAGWQVQWFNSVTHLPSRLITAAKG